MIFDLMAQSRSLGAQDLYIKEDREAFCRVRGDLVKITGTRVSGNDIEEFLDKTIEGAVKEILLRKGWVRYSFPRGRNLSKGPLTRVDAMLERNGIGLSLRFMPSSIPELGSVFGQAWVPDILEKGHGLFIISGKPSSGRSTLLASFVAYLNKKGPFRILEIDDAVSFEHEDDKSFIRQVETSSHRDIDLESLKGSWDIVIVDQALEVWLLDSLLRTVENETKVLLNVTAGSVTKALEQITRIFPHEEREEKRERLARVLDGSLYIHPLWKEDGKVVLASELLVATAPVRSLLRDGKFKEIEDTIATGRKHGMLTLEASLSDLLGH